MIGGLNKRTLLREFLSSKQYQSAMNRLKFRHTAMTPEDLQGEFHIGVMQGLPRVKKIGDPMAYLAQSGMWRVRSALRNALKQTAQQRCICGHVRTFDYDRACKACSVKGNHETVVRFEKFPEDFQLAVDEIAVVMATSSILKQFEEGSMKSQVVRLIMAGCPKENLAEVLGVSRQRIHVLLNRIKSDLEDA